MDSSEDPQLNQFIRQIVEETQSQNLQEQILGLNNRCFDLCLTDSRPPSKLDGKTQTCLSNCVNRILDAKVFMFEHFQKNGSAGGNF